MNSVELAKPQYKKLITFYLTYIAHSALAKCFNNLGIYDYNTYKSESDNLKLTY